MNEVRGTRLTYKGLTLLAKGQTGQLIYFTKVLLGDGLIAADQDIRQLDGLVNPKMELPIKSCTVTGVGTTLLETELKNQKLEQGFFARELGIFAQDGDEEILYAVRNTGDDSEYIPAGGGSEVWDLIYEVVTVIDQAANVAANIDGSIAYINRVDFNKHKEDTNPHPDLLQTGKAVESFTHLNCDFDGGNKKLNWISLDNARKAILGGEASTILQLKNRITQLEQETANMAVALTSQEIYPDYNMLLAEDFRDTNCIDTFITKVTSAVAGDNGIDVENLNDVILGAWYTISDGIHDEYIRVKSCIKNGSVYRILAEECLKNTYLLSQTYILRTTAQIGVGFALGSGNQKGIRYESETEWKGINANVLTEVKLNTSASASDLFHKSGDVDFNINGYFTLINEGEF